MFGLFSGSRRMRRPDGVIAAVSARLVDEPDVRAVSPVGRRRHSLEVRMSDGATRYCDVDKLVPVVLAADEASQPGLIDGFVRAAQTGPGTVAIDKLIPAIRPDRDIVPGMVTRAFAGDVTIVLMHNSETLLMPVKQSDLKSAGLSEDDAWLAAGENLRPYIASGRAQDIDGCMSFETEATWIGSSALVMPDLFHSFRRKMGAQTLYLAAPRRDGVHFVDAEEAGGLEAIRRVVMAEQSVGAPQSLCIFRLGETDTLIQAAFSLGDDGRDYAAAAPPDGFASDT